MANVASTPYTHPEQTLALWLQEISRFRQNYFRICAARPARHQPALRQQQASLREEVMAVLDTLTDDMSAVERPGFLKAAPLDQYSHQLAQHILALRTLNGRVDQFLRSI